MCVCEHGEGRSGVCGLHAVLRITTLPNITGDYLRRVLDLLEVDSALNEYCSIWTSALCGDKSGWAWCSPTALAPQSVEHYTGDLCLCVVAWWLAHCTMNRVTCVRFPGTAAISDEFYPMSTPILGLHQVASPLNECLVQCAIVSNRETKQSGTLQVTPPCCSRLALLSTHCTMLNGGYMLLHVTDTYNTLIQHKGRVLNYVASFGYVWETKKRSRYMK